jgi:hypothetical protein
MILCCDPVKIAQALTLRDCTSGGGAVGGGRRFDDRERIATMPIFGGEVGARKGFGLTRGEAREGFPRVQALYAE